jgi:hypothetical protein
MEQRYPMRLFQYAIKNDAVSRHHLGLIEVVVRSCRFYFELLRYCCWGKSNHLKFSVAHRSGDVRIWRFEISAYRIAMEQG